MIILGPLAILGLLLLIALGGTLVLLLWNGLLPTLFGWPQITFWQGLGLLALCRILFGGMGSGGSRHSSFRRRMAERCGQMSPEDRGRLKQRLRERWGFDATDEAE